MEDYNAIRFLCWYATRCGACNELSPEVNGEETSYMLMPRRQNARKDRNINIVNRIFENLADLKCLGKTAIDQNFIREEIKSR
jgi:hypothetical protein